MTAAQADALDVTPPSGSGIAIYPPGATYGPRRMQEYEFVWMMEGDARYRWGDEEADAPAGSLVLCRPNAVDSFAWDPKRRTRHAYFHFQVNRLPDDWPPARTWPLARPMPPDDILRPLFRQIVTGHPLTPLQSRLTIALMLTAYVQEDLAAGGIAPDSWPDPVERAWVFLHDRLESEPQAALTLEALARAAFVTPEHLCRLFQKHVGHSPIETVRLARLDRAATLLARSNSSVGEIAEFCGFATPFHFARLFRQAYGQSPTELRAAVRAGQTPPVPRLLRQGR